MYTNPRGSDGSVYIESISVFVPHLVSLVCGTWTAGLAKQFDKKQQGLGVNTAKVYFAFTPSAADYVVVEGNKMVKLIKRTVN